MTERTKVGDWRKISDLGSGAFGVVSLWKSDTTEDCIAVKRCKFLSPDSLSNRQRQRWCEEVKRMAQMDHPNIVHHKPLPNELKVALQKYNPTGLPLLSMEYCSLGNLRRHLHMPQNLCGLVETQLRKALMDIANGVTYLHTLGIAHRDIKPDNVVLQLSSESKDEVVYKLIDLGYAKELGDSMVSLVGTSHYLAPEIVKGERYGPQVDYWSMGVLAYELTTGTLPFLPEFSPIERFSKLAEKSDHDICAYISYSGAVVFSSEIRPECRAGGSLRHHLANWLKSALRFDAKRRGICSNEDSLGTLSHPKQVDEIQQKPFERLIQSVSKPVVKLFYANKMELYEYEIDNETLVGTIREWVSRDVKATKHEHVLLMLYNPKSDSVCLQLTEDQVPLLSVLLNNQNIHSMVVNVLALRTDVPLVQTTAPVAFPKIVREAMTSAKTFNLKYSRTLCSQTVYLVTVEKEMSDMYRSCWKWNIEHAVPQAVQQLQVAVKKLDGHTDKLVHRLECYNGLHSHSDMKSQYDRCQLEYYKQLVECVLRAQKLRHKLKQRVLTLKGWAGTLQQQVEQLTMTLQKYSLDDLYKEALSLPEKKDKLLPHVTRIISNFMKRKHGVVNNKELKKYSGAICKLHCHISDITEWLSEFEKYLNINTAALEAAEIQLRKSQHLSLKRSCSKNSLEQDLLALPCKYLLFENQELRYKVNDIINKGILAHKNHMESVKM
ncbi:unnamed protein product [Callosobruchus maculatus]|uniref:IkappaB kinase n=1 Tax=Callosobruchus maculatus TaxID=64391 RepID=A0A653CXX4_CALMS|nr:unnamed protein product [Callosobruchus maculatus]